MKIIIVFITLWLSVLPVFGEKNEVTGYMQVGTNTVHGTYGGLTGLYKRNMSNRFTLTGGLNLSTKNCWGFGGILADATYRVSVKNFNLFISNRVVYNHYSSKLYTTNELLYRIAATWQSRFFEITFGNTFFSYFQNGSSVFEPITWSVGFAGNIRPRENRWNAGLFIRNYDDFIYENFNLFFGVAGWYDILKNWRLIAELDIRPAGSLNQLAVRYETYVKLGVKYKW